MFESFIKRLPRNLTAKNSYDCTTFTEDMRKSILAPFFLKHRVGYFQ